MTLNLPRVHARRQADLMNAVAFAHGEVPPADWYEHLTDNPEEARLWRSQALLELVSRRALG